MALVTGLNPEMLPRATVLTADLRHNFFMLFGEILNFNSEPPAAEYHH